jgi:hypothetical protein
VEWFDPSGLSFKSDDLSQVSFVTEQGLYRAGDRRWQNRTEADARAAIIDPFASAAMLQGFRVTEIERAFGDHKLRCDVFARTSGGISGPNQYCSDPKDSALRYVRGPGWWQIAYNDIVSFAGHFVARNVDVADGSRPFLKLRMTKLELLDYFDEKEFAPAEGAVNFVIGTDPQFRVLNGMVRQKRRKTCSELNFARACLIYRLIDGEMPDWWAYQDSNLEPKHYECSALTD